MSVVVEVGGVKHTVYVIREKALRPEEGKFRAVIVPAIDEVGLYPPMKDVGAETEDELFEMLGKWNPALANLQLD